MATYQPKKKGGEKVLSPYEIKLLQIQQQQQELIRQATVQEFEDLVKAGKQSEADAFREKNLKWLPMKDAKGAFYKWKKALVEKTQREEVLASQLKKVEKLRATIAERASEIEEQRLIFVSDAVAVKFCLAKEGAEFKDKTVEEFEQSLITETVRHYRFVKERNKSITKETQQLEVSALHSDTEEEGGGILFVDLNLSSPKSASSH